LTFKGEKMDLYGVLAAILSISSILVCIILFINTYQLKKELDYIKQSTRLTQEELEKITERLEKVRTLK